EKGAPVDPAADGWATFASNVGKERMERREAMEQRLRWVGAIVLVALVAALGFFTVRYFGVRAGWWSSVIPLPQKAHATIAHLASWTRR
ncbi:MAG: hypothetical protein WA815_05170, partial [Terracidiphilus sp.]